MLEQREASAQDCDCAPTEQEKRALWPAGITRRGAIALGILGAAALGVTAAPRIPAAFAADYPSWPDVEAAMASEDTKAAQIAKIEQLIKDLQSAAAAAQQRAEQAGADFFAAQQAFFDAAARANTLQGQADAQAAKAQEAADEAGRVAAQLYRTGGDNAALQLFLSGSAAGVDDLLARLGTMDKLLQSNRDVYAQAVAARNSAQSLSDQAAVQRKERDRLQQVAQQKMAAAQDASAAADAAVKTQNAHLGDLQAQLAALHEATAATLAQYQAGVEARRKAEEERLRQEELARQQAAQNQAAQNQGGGNNSTASSGGGGGGGSASGSGWVRPSDGWQSSGYGGRDTQCSVNYCSSGYHYGVDLASGCGSNIRAAHDGTVVYAGYNGGYGNYIKINHGGGIGTGYAHIMYGGLYVSPGQYVSAGQVIAGVGNTGNSFGCHLHFETYVNDFPVNPIDFMAARGISV